MKLGVTANLNRPGTEQVLGRLIRWCSKHDAALLLSEELREVVDSSVNLVPRDELPARSDIILSMGGDGTLLAAARLVSDAGVPILGINVGSLGFLTEQTPQDLERTLDRLLNEDYEIEKRMVLEARITNSESGDTNFALNDIVIGRIDIRMIKLALYSNGDYICSYAADGLVVSTPTGSTAYSLSVGGPILNPEMDAIIASPIAPHSLASRPLVFHSDEQLTLEIISETDEVLMTTDGQVPTPLKKGDKILVKKANYRVSLVRFEENSFYHVLRSKLHWGFVPVSDSTDND